LGLIKVVLPLAVRWVKIGGFSLGSTTSQEPKDVPTSSTGATQQRLLVQRQSSSRDQRVTIKASQLNSDPNLEAHLEHADNEGVVQINDLQRELGDLDCDEICSKICSRMSEEMAYIPRRGLNALLHYKYAGGEYSWLDNKLNPFWAAAAEMLPDTMAPNLVTLVGLAHLFVIAALALIYDPQLRGESPSWVYLVNAYCIFMYQTFDAMDGKQARRTRSSSPLGQLFDHGCDSLGTNFIGLGLCSLMGFGPTFSTMISLATLQIPFFLCQWEENHVHILRAQVANFGVTEGQYLSVALNIITAIFGAGFWSAKINHVLSKFVHITIPLEFLDELEVRNVSLVIAAFFPTILAVTSIINVYKSPGNFSRALILVIPLVLAQAYQWSIYLFSPASVLFHAYPIPFVILLGMLHSHLSNRIIVASVCHIEAPLFQRILYPIPFMIAMLAYADDLPKPNADLVTAIEAALLAHAVAIFLQYAHFVIWVTNAICKLLKIRCFSIVKP